MLNEDMILKNRKIYIVMTQTGTFLSRLLKFFSKDEYNHVSIALDDRLEEMYSFGRLNPYNPFVGGFVKESPHYGTFKRFSDTDATITTVDVTEKQYRAVKDMLSKMYEEKEKYRYNYKGLLWAFFGKSIEELNRFYCSEFVKYVLVENGVVDKSVFNKITRPVDFKELPNTKTVYVGKLRTYALNIKELLEVFSSKSSEKTKKTITN